MKQIPSIGRVIHVVLPEVMGGVVLKPGAVGQHRPATIVRVWAGANPGEVADFVNAIVSLDGLNDCDDPIRLSAPQVHCTSLCFDPTAQRPGTWHWPEQA